MAKNDDQYNVSSSDSDEFRAAIDAIPQHIHKKHAPLRDTNQPSADFVYPDGFNPNDKRGWLGPQDTFFWQRSSINKQQTSSLKSGKIHIDARCDLHNLTLAEADTVVNGFLQSALANKWRCVMIITGKGIGSNSVLKNWLPAYLKLQHFVLAASTAAGKHGGAGAFYVLLKNTDK